MILPPIGIFSAMNFYNNNLVDIPTALYLGLIFTILSGLYIIFNKEK